MLKSKLYTVKRKREGIFCFRVHGAEVRVRWIYKTITTEVHFQEDRICAVGGRSVGWSWKYMAVSVSGSKVRRRNLPLIYILLALTFGYTMIVAESAIGRMTRKSPVGAFLVIW